MATRLFPVVTGLGQGTPTITPAYSDTWEVVPPVPFRRYLTPVAPTVNAPTEGSTTYRSYIPGQDHLGAQLISRPIKAQTISGTFKGLVMRSDYNNSGAVGLPAQLTIKVVSNDGTVVRGHLYAGESNPQGNYHMSYYYSSYATMSSPVPSSSVVWEDSVLNLTPVTAQEGDRIVIELGGRENTYSGYNWYNTWLTYSTTIYESISGYNTYVYDMSVYNSPSNWYEFSQNIQFVGNLTGSISQTVNLGGTLAPRELASNGTFETTAGAFTSTGWSAGTNNTIGSSALGEGYNGSNYALKITRSNATLGNAYAAITVTGIVSGQKYRVDCWVKKSAGVADPQVDIQVAAAFTSATYYATGTWQKMSRVFTAAATSYIFYIRLGQTVAESGSAVLIDNFSVIKYTTYEPMYSRNLLQVPVEMSATPTLTDLRTFVGDATTDMVDVTMSATVTISDAVVMVGQMDVDVQMSSGQMQVDAPISGNMDVVVDLDVTVRNEQEIGSANNPTLILSTNPGQPTTYTTVSLTPLAIEMDTSAFNRIRSDVYIPPDPEAATPGTPAVAQGVYVRALHGVIVDMPAPTITDGKPT